MNILEQEDLIKGLPDQVLVEEAQAPTGNVPQYLVVSEIQRREKMREKFNEQVPQNTVTDQIISGGIAAMNPNPDPLMGAAMGAPPPMMGQDPMMGQMQDPMMQPPMQDPMMGQMPQDIAMGQQMPQDPMMQMQDPMMQQGIMAAGGGMMPYRMSGGQGTSAGLYSNLGAQEPGEVMRQLLSLGLSEAEVAEIIEQSTDPLALLSQQNQELNFVNQPDYSIAALAQGQYGATGKDAKRFGAEYPLGTKVDENLINAVTARNTADKTTAMDDVFRLSGQAGNRLIEGRYKDTLDRLEADAMGIGDDQGLGRGWSGPDGLLAAREDYQETMRNLLPDYGTETLGPDGKPIYTGLRKSVMDLGAQRQQQATGRAEAIAKEFADYEEKTEGELREDMISTALMKLGAGIASGQSDLGLGSVGDAVGKIRSEGRKELRGERRRSLLDQRHEERLGVAAVQAAEDKNLGFDVSEVESKYNNSVANAKFGLETQRQVVGEINRVISDKRAAEAVVLSAYMGIENLAMQLTDAAVKIGTSEELTNREILRSAGDIIDTAIQKHSPMLKPEDVVFMVDALTKRLMPVFERVSGRRVSPEEAESVFDRQASSLRGTGNRSSNWSDLGSTP